MTKEQEYFWQQYDGLVRAIDLPKDYKIKDMRIYCVNNDCFCRKTCLFWNRFEKSQLHVKDEIKRLKNDQKNGRKRETWDKHYPKPNYFSASFGFFEEQHGIQPCKHFVENNE